MNLEKLIKKIESEKPESGIGAASAATGIIATSLIIKAAHKSGLKEIENESYTIKKDLKNLIKQDMEAYKTYIKACESKDEKKIEKSLKKAVETPMRILKQDYRIVELAEIVLEKGKQSLALESYGAATIAKAGINSAYGIIDVNLKDVKDQVYKESVKQEKYELRTKAKAIETRMYIKLGDIIFKK